MSKFESQQPPLEATPRAEAAAPAAGAAASAVLRAVKQAERTREEARPAHEAIATARRQAPQPAPSARPVAAAVTAAESAAATATAVAEPVKRPQPRFAEAAVVLREKGSAISEQYRIMRTNLMAKFEDGRFCIIVTSAEPGEGKSVTTVNLALALAELQEGRVIIVDGDLRKGRLAKLAGVSPSPGVSDILLSRAALRNAIQSTGVANLDVLPAGQLTPDEAGEMLGRPELAELICALRRQYEFVLVDTPPVNMVSDVGMIGRCASDALMVVRMNRTSREAVNKAMRLLRAVNINIAGLALTHQKYFIPGYIYKYS